MVQQPDGESQQNNALRLVLLVFWNVLCVAVPVVMWFQPSPEPSISRAVVLVVFAGPALWLAFTVNMIYWFRQRPLSVMRLSFVLTCISGVMALVWLVALLTA